jgi:hypothetical protein
MPPKRDQLTEERLNALIEMLEAKGIINTEEKDALEHTAEIGQANEVAKAVLNGKNPRDIVIQSE